MNSSTTTVTIRNGNSSLSTVGIISYTYSTTRSTTACTKKKANRQYQRYDNDAQNLACFRQILYPIEEF